MHSTRFNLQVILTEHAGQRMIERSISLDQVREIIDSGTPKKLVACTTGFTNTCLIA